MEFQTGDVRRRCALWSKNNKRDVYLSVRIAAVTSSIPHTMITSDDEQRRHVYPAFLYISVKAEMKQEFEMLLSKPYPFQ